MAEENYAGTEVRVDGEGYLLEPANWNEEIARGLARREGIGELTEEMMEIVKFLRSYYHKFNAFPILNYVCKNLHQARDCMSEEFINPEKAWKIAGLPKIDNVHFVSVDGKNYLLEECC